MTTIYVGNTQSIADETLRDYFSRFGQVETCFHNCTRAADEWLIDYRFVRFSTDTDLSVFLTNKIDHSICRTILDIQSYDAAFNDETRLTLDKKICIAHTDPKLDRNVVKKTFTKYGRVLNCTCVSSGNGVEYVYIEFDTINAVRSIFAAGQRHFAGRTSLAVKQPLRPSQVGPKLETTPKSMSTNKILSSSSNLSQSIDSSTTTGNIQPTLFTISISDQELHELEHEYGLEIRDDFATITHCIDGFLRKQRKSYRLLRHFILESRNSSSSSSEEEEIDGSSKRVKYQD